jgi:hypothetical protein
VLKISEKWVKAMKTSIYKKLDVKKYAQFRSLIMQIDPSVKSLLEINKPKKKTEELQKTPDGEIVLPRGKIMLQ